MQLKIQKKPSDSDEVKKCSLHGAFYFDKCPLCNGGKRMEKLKFYDLKTRKPFVTSNYKIVTKKGRRFAIAKAPSGAESWRIIKS